MAITYYYIHTYLNLPRLQQKAAKADIFKFLESHIKKVYSIKRANELKNCLSFLQGKECPHQKKIGFLKTSVTVNNFSFFYKSHFKNPFKNPTSYLVEAGI